MAKTAVASGNSDDWWWHEIKALREEIAKLRAEIEMLRRNDPTRHMELRERGLDGLTEGW